jgi:hypothetical protein
MTIKTKEARSLGAEIASLVEMGEISQAYALLTPVLAERTKFDMLRLIGHPVGNGSLDTTNVFLERIAADKSEGGWAVIASALEAQLDRDQVGAINRCHKYIILGDVWYAADIMGEGVAGSALVKDFYPTLDLLTPWRVDTNRWVRRAVGIFAHFWAKRSRGEKQLEPQAKSLLDFLDPMFEEWEMDTVKGIGWGLKTLGRNYPDLMSEWLEFQIIQRNRRCRAIMLRKAATYLPNDQRERFLAKLKE